jgi:hypothetical protein
MKNQKLASKRSAKTIVATLLAVGLVGVSHASAQTAQDRMHKEQADARAAEYHREVVIPMNASIEAQRAAIMAQPSKPILPGEMRDAVNYGALAWYQKGPNQYGYVFNGGSIRDVSASLNVDIECTRRRITCQGKMVVVNQWLAIGSYNNGTRFMPASGPTRAAAEARVQEECRKQNSACIIKETFEVMPHRRGPGFQRLQTVVR